MTEYKCGHRCLGFNCEPSYHINLKAYPSYCNLCNVSYRDNFIYCPCCGEKIRPLHDVKSAFFSDGSLNTDLLNTKVKGAYFSP